MAAPPPRPVLDTRRFGRTSPVFLIILGVCCLIALLALTVILLQHGPAPALVGLLLALLPIPLLLSVVLYLDRLEPEPRAAVAVVRTRRPVSLPPWLGPDETSVFVSPGVWSGDPE
jgi:protease PrsW